ncbi:MAG: SsrA-binding protein SmpB [Phycisphaerales bacterium JB059]
MAKGKHKKGRGEQTPTIENRRARHEYFIEETLEVGVVLQGSEVKSIRDGACTIAEGYVTARAEPAKLTLHGINIGAYGPAGAGNHPAVRNRALLAHKPEIKKLARQVDQKGVTIVPLKLYFKDGMVKLLIGVARGKQAHDKRKTIADRDAKRDIQRAMSTRM